MDIELTVIDLGDAMAETKEVGEPIRYDNVAGEKGFF